MRNFKSLASFLFIGMLGASVSFAEAFVFEGSGRAEVLDSARLENCRGLVRLTRSEGEDFLQYHLDFKGVENCSNIEVRDQKNGEVFQDWKLRTVKKPYQGNFTLSGNSIRDLERDGELAIVIFSNSKKTSDSLVLRLRVPPPIFEEPDLKVIDEALLSDCGGKVFLVVRRGIFSSHYSLFFSGVEFCSNVTLYKNSSYLRSLQDGIRLEKHGSSFYEGKIRLDSTTEWYLTLDGDLRVSVFSNSKKHQDLVTLGLKNDE